tara:strand:- start:648 stop:1235 length:588 start_codon:yes stop_codon:yes gene_type:complete
MNENLKKLASEAVNLHKKIKADTEKLQNIKKEIISKSSGANSSFAINLIAGKVRVTRSKKLKSFLLNKKKFSSLSIQLKKKLVRNKVVKLSYLINTEVYTQLLNDGLVDDELKNLVDEKKRQPFYISIFLNKKELKEIPKENEFEEILEAAETESSSEDETDIIDPADDLFIKSVFSDDEPEEISETEKEEKGFS